MPKREFVSDPEEIIRFRINQVTGALGSDDPHTQKLKNTLQETLTSFANHPSYGLSPNLRENMYDKFSDLLDSMEKLISCDDSVSKKDILSYEKNVMEAANNLKPGLGERLINIYHQMYNNIFGKGFEKEMETYKEKESTAEKVYQGAKTAIDQLHSEPRDAPRPGK